MIITLRKRVNITSPFLILTRMKIQYCREEMIKISDFSRGVFLKITQFNKSGRVTLKMSKLRSTAVAIQNLPLKKHCG